MNPYCRWCFDSDLIMKPPGDELSFILFSCLCHVTHLLTSNSDWTCHELCGLISPVFLLFFTVIFSCIPPESVKLPYTRIPCRLTHRKEGICFRTSKCSHSRKLIYVKSPMFYPFYNTFCISTFILNPLNMPQYLSLILLAGP